MIDLAADFAAIVSVDGLFRDAVWRVGGTGEGTAVRILVRRPDQVAEWGGGRVTASTVRLTVPVAGAPTLRRGDRLTLGDGTVYAVLADPQRDAQRLMWSAEAQVVTA